MYPQYLVVESADVVADNELGGSDELNELHDPILGHHEELVLVVAVGNPYRNA